MTFSIEKQKEIRKRLLNKIIIGFPVRRENRFTTLSEFKAVEGKQGKITRIDFHDNSLRIEYLHHFCSVWYNITTVLKHLDSLEGSVVKTPENIFDF